MDSFSFSINGSTLASLITQISTANSDLEGFLFGNISNSIKQIYEDKYEDQRNMTVIGIQGSMILGNHFSFVASNTLSINNDQIKKSIETTNLTLLGWFKYRKDSSLRPSLRELSIHSALQKFYSMYLREKGLNENIPLLFGLFGTSSSPASTIHNFDYIFLSIQNNKYNAIDVSVLNLVHSSNREYTEFTPLSPSTLSVELNPLIQQVPSHNNQLEKYVNNILKQIEVVADSVHKTNSEIRALEEEIKRLSETP